MEKYKKSQSINKLTKYVSLSSIALGGLIGGAAFINYTPQSHIAFADTIQGEPDETFKPLRTGQWIDTPVENMMKDGNQSLDVQYQSIWRYNDGTKTTDYIIPGKTIIAVTGRGAKNTIKISINGRETRDYRDPDYEWPFTVPENLMNDAANKRSIKIAYDPNNKIGGASGKPQSYTIPNPNFETKREADFQNAQVTAVSNLYAFASQRKTAINADKTLLSSEKALQITQLESTVRDYENQIYQATTKEGVSPIYSEGEAKVNAFPQSGLPVDTQRANAKIQLEKEYNDAKSKITDNPTLSQTEEDNQIAILNERYQSALLSLNNADNADTILSNKNSSINLIKDVPKDGEPLESRKQKAVDSLNETASETIKKIQENDSLTTVEKNRQISNITATRDKWINTITSDVTDNADSVINRLEQGNQEIVSEYKQGNSLDSQKLAAINGFRNLAKITKDNIDKEPSLSVSEKIDAKTIVERDLASSVDAIYDSKNADQIGSAKSNWSPKLSTFTKGKNVSVRQEEVNTILSNKANDIKNQIKNDDSLSTADKKSQSDAVDSALSQAVSENQKAVTADDVIQAQNDGIVNISNQYKKLSLSDQKVAAVSELRSQAQLLKEAINNDDTLTTTEKESQKKQVDDVLSESTDAVNLAKNSDAVTENKNTGSSNLTDKRKVGESLQNRRKAALAEITQTGNKVIDDINNDVSLSSAEKSSQISQVNDLISDSRFKLNRATTADSINNEKESSIARINNAHIKADLNETKNQAIIDLNNKAQQTKDMINSSNDLKSEEKSPLAKDVDRLLETAISDVNKAENYDSVIKLQRDTTDKLVEVYKPNDNLAETRNSAKNELANTAKDTRDTINRDVSLTKAQKEAQLKEVDDQLNLSQSQVSLADNADKVSEELKKGQTNIAGSHKTKNDLDSQKQTIINDLSTVRDNIKSAIDKDQTLTSTEKQNQKNEVDSAYEKAKSAIQQQTNADDLNSNKILEVQNISSPRRSGSSITDRSDTANKELENAAEATKQKINVDKTLTAQAKELQLAEVNQTLVSAKAAVKNVDTADEVDNEKNKGINSIQSKHKPNDLQSQKDAAKAELGKVAQETRSSIDADKTLSSSEREIQRRAVNGAEEDAYKAVDAAQNADDVVKALNDGKTDITAQYDEGKSISDRQKDTFNDIEKHADSIKQNINDDRTLTTEQRNSQIKKVTDKLSQAQQDLLKEDTADKIDTFTTQAKNEITSYHVGETNIDQQKESAYSRLDKVKQTAQEAIEKDSSLTTDEKQSQQRALQKALQDAKDSVFKSQNADEINKNSDSGSKTIESQHNPGTSISTRKINARDSLQKQAANVIDKIKNDQTLTTSQISQQISDVNSALDSAIIAVNNDEVDTADEINTVYTEHLDLINSKHQTKDVISEQKLSAIKDLRSQADTTKQDIDDNDDMTESEKVLKKAAVDETLSQRVQVVMDASNAQSVSDSKFAGIQIIQSKNVADRTVESRRSEFSNSLDELETKVKSDIEKDDTLTPTEKAEQSQRVSDKTAEMKRGLSNYTTSDSLIKYYNDSEIAIMSEYKTGASLLDRKQAAMSYLDTVSDAVKDSITSDDNLSQSEKSSQKSNIDGVLVNARKSIFGATSIVEIEEFKKDYEDLINKQHVRAEVTIDQQKKNAETELRQRAAEVKAAIEKDKSLSEAQRREQLNDVDETLKVAINAIENTASNSDDISNKKNQAIKDIDSKYKTGMSMDDQKTDAIDDLEVKAKNVMDEIDADNTLSESEKNSQKALVEKALQQAKDRIVKSKTSDDISKNKEFGLADIESKYNKSSSVSDRKQTAELSFEKVARETLEKIAADDTLSDAEQQEQQKNVNTELDKAKKSLEGLEKAEDIEVAKETGNQNITSQYKPGQHSLDGQKLAAITALRSHAASVKQTIDKNNHMTSKERLAKKSDVDDLLSNQIQVIMDSTSSQLITNNKDVGIESISMANIPNQQLNERISDSEAALELVASEIKMAINSDDSLSEEEQIDQENNVDTALEQALEKLRASQDADQVLQREDEGQMLIMNQYKTGLHLSDQKLAAIESLEDYAETIKFDIDKDKTLSAEEKEAQKLAVDQVLSDGRKGLREANNSFEIEGIKEIYKDAIKDQHQSSPDSLENQKEIAVMDLQEKAEQLKAQISSDKTLNNTERQKQIEQLNNALKLAISDVNDAQDSDSISYRKAENIDKMNKIPRSNVTPAPSPTPAPAPNPSKPILSLIDIGNRVKQAISNDSTLTDAEKLSQINAVNVTVDSYRQLINDNIGDSQQLIQEATTEIEAQHKTNTRPMESLRVSYVPGYSIVGWTIDSNNQAKPSDKYYPNDSLIKVFKNNFKVVDGMKYYKVADPTDNNWVQAQYFSPVNANTGQTKTVSYIKGYGVQNWMLDDKNSMAPITRTYTLADTPVETFDTQVINNISYTRVNSADSNVWIETHYLDDSEETPMSAVLTISNIPSDHQVYLRDLRGNITSQSVRFGTQWKVFGQKRIHGTVYYRIGNDNQWIETQYAEF